MLHVKLQELALSTSDNGNRRASHLDKIQQIQLHVIPLLRDLKYPFTCLHHEAHTLLLAHPIFHSLLLPREKLSAQPSSSTQPLQNHHFLSPL